jgi:hypothetical protein
MENTFQQLMVPYIRPEIFPNQLLPLARHFRNPSASADTTLSLALKQFDQQNDKNYLKSCMKCIFRIKNGKIFKNKFAPSATNA